MHYEGGGGGGGGAARGSGFQVNPKMLPTKPNIKPMMKPPRAVGKLKIEKINTMMEPVLTFPGSPELIMTAPISTIIPKIRPKAPETAINPPSPPSPGTRPTSPPR
jgi:hypothetical protein